MITTCVKDFDTVIKPLLEIKYRIKTIQIGKAPVVRSGVPSGRRMAVMTPKGEFESITAAAAHYGVTLPTVINWIKKNKEGFRYV